MHPSYIEDKFKGIFYPSGQTEKQAWQVDKQVHTLVL